MIGGFRSLLCVSVFQGSLLMIVIMIDAAKNAIVKAAFELQSLHVCEKRSNIGLTGRYCYDMKGNQVHLSLL